MARMKQVRPMQRIPSGEVMDDLRSPTLCMNGQVPQSKFHAVGMSEKKEQKSSRPPPGLLTLFICVGGIYASFLSWGVLQERITTTPYATTPSSFIPKQGAVEYFRFPIVLNTVQSVFAAISGSIYLLATTGELSIFPSRAIIFPLLVVSMTSSLASPFGYASLAHVDYLTYVLGKSCKLLPVMFLHIVLFGRRYPISKYLVVLAVTAGVVIFTLYQSSKASHKSPPTAKSSIYGLSLLSVNLLFDGLTNTIQDHIFSSPQRYKKISGPQMMVAMNLFATLLTCSYLYLTPMMPTSLMPEMGHSSTAELSSAVQFLTVHPQVLSDVLAFGACGAIGQLFIYATLERFSSILLVTVTVTRKMLTMILSLVWFGKRLSPGQWSGVGLVFAGVGIEGLMARQEKLSKEGKARKKI